MILRRECAWCKAYLGGDPLSPLTTHGICPTCMDEMLAENSKTQVEDRLDYEENHENQNTGNNITE